MIEDGSSLPQELKALAPRIITVGCGGAGNNSIHRLYKLGIKGSTTIAINTDWQDLEMTDADKKVLIGKRLTQGKGAGGDPDVAQRAAEESRLLLMDMMRGANLVFLTSGMGGGTGTGTTPYIAELAKELNAIVVAIVTTPFEVEKERKKKADEGIKRLKEHADSVIILDNNRLLPLVGNEPMEKAFSVMDQFIAEIIKGLTETILEPSLINLDFADVRSIMSLGGMATLLYGEAEKMQPDLVIEDALQNPLFDVDVKGATGALVHITSSDKMSLKCAQSIALGITTGLDPKANVILGARVDPRMEDGVRVMSIFTGIGLDLPDEVVADPSAWDAKWDIPMVG